MDTTVVAKRKCPGFVAVHVETIDCDETTTALLEESDGDGAHSDDDEVLSCF